MAGFRLIGTATTLEAVESLRASWQNMAIGDVDADIDTFIAAIRASDGGAEPHVVHLRREDGEVARDLFAVARLEQATMPLRLGYRALGAVRVSALVSSFGGLLGVEDDADAQALLAELRRPLAQGEADLLILRNIEPGRPLHEAACGSLLSHRQKAAHRWTAPVPGSLNEFLKSRSAKTRQKLRWEERVFREAYGERLKMRVFSRPEDLDRICRDAEAVAALTYQRALGVGFRNKPAERALIEFGLKEGRHRTWMLYLDERPVAFWSGLGYRGTFSVTALGFDPAHARHSVGRFAMFRMVEDLCADPAVTELDLGPGDADYKMAFARPARLEGTVLLAAPRLRPILLIAALSGLAAANRLGRKFLEEKGWRQRLKKLWRLRLAGGGAWTASGKSAAPDEARP
ncbi:MAG: GNAT family N-acetyltransferase [Methylobacterium mesophilicum]|nr:GNAT family N-acetyltransferase [Methylobacterium mesophilicum]